MDSNKEHPLVLRVMRLTKPTIFSPPQVYSESADLNSITNDNNADTMGIATSELLMLPQSFGSIFLGETFVSYLSVNNESSSSVLSVSLKADLQTSSQRISLSGNSATDSLSSQASLDHIISHEVKELGTHILVCIVTYKNDADEMKSFRKFFKFQVLKPLDVKTKFYNVDCDKLFLETQIQNITQSPICMERVNVEPSATYTCKALNSSFDVNNTYGCNSYINPSDTRQYLYMLQLKKEFYKDALSDKVNAIGKLDIVWKSSLGERGRLQTSQLQRVYTPQRDLILKVTSAPSEITEMKQFRINCSLTNLSDRTKSLTVDFDSNQTDVLWLEIGEFKGGKIAPKESKQMTLTLLPISPGLQSVGGLLVTDNDLNRTITFDGFYDVLILTGNIS